MKKILLLLLITSCTKKEYITNNHIKCDESIFEVHFSGGNSDLKYQVFIMYKNNEGGEYIAINDIDTLRHYNALPSNKYYKLYEDEFRWAVDLTGTGKAKIYYNHKLIDSVSSPAPDGFQFNGTYGDTYLYIK